MAKTAIEGKRGTTFWQAPEDLVIIGLDTDDGPGHYLYDDRITLPLDELKVQGVMDNGVDVPVHVIKDGDRLLVVDGRQRVRWAREANRRLREHKQTPIQVEVQLKRGDELDHARRMIRDNEHREADPPYVKAKKAQRLLDRGMSVAQVAKEFAVSVQALNSWLRLLELAPEVQTRVASGEVSATEALKLHAASHEEQIEATKVADPVQRKAVVKKVQQQAERRPSVKTLREVATVIGDKRIEAVLRFVSGEISEEELRIAVPEWPGKKVKS